MSVVENVVDRYLTFWNSEGPEQRELADQTFVPQVRYYAPVGLLTGAEALIDFRTRFVDFQPGARLVTRTEPESHHDRVRLQWEIRLADGATFAAGSDVLVIAGDRIDSVTSFLDQAPEGFDPAHDHD